MKYKIELTEQVENDLRGIYEHIAFTLLEPVVAAKILDRIEEKISSLSEMPNRFKVFEKEPWNSKDLRQMSVNNFIVFYFSNAEDKLVTVIRVMYGGRDLEKQLKNKI